MYSCIECKKGYHIQCFAIFHHKGLFENVSDIALKKVIEKMDGYGKAVRKRKSASICSLKDIKLPCLEKKKAIEVSL